MCILKREAAVNKDGGELMFWMDELIRDENGFVSHRFLTQAIFDLG